MYGELRAQQKFVLPFSFTIRFSLLSKFEGPFPKPCDDLAWNDPKVSKPGFS